jgi:heptosyltransferase-3
VRTEQTASKNVVVFRTGQLGDTIVALPAIHAIHDRYPNHRLILLTPLQLENHLVSPLEILGGTQLFSQILYYSPPSSKPSTWIRWVKLARELRRLQPDAFFYLRDYPYKSVYRDKLFFRGLAGIKKTYGLDPVRYSFGDRDATNRLTRFPTEVKRLLDLVSGTDYSGSSYGPIDFRIPISDRDNLRINSIWDRLGICCNETIVGLGPGSKMPAKRWPLDRFIEVARSVFQGFANSRIIVFGGQDDSSLGEEMRREFGNNVINMAGELRVLESAEALRRCHVYVGKDTGVMHLAAAVGTPCVAIFSARDHPGRWEPLGSKHAVFRKDPACAGCLLDVCTEQAMRCLKDIGSEEVVGAVIKILMSRPRLMSSVTTENSEQEFA